MGRVSALPQLVLPPMLLVLVLGCSSRAMPRSGRPIVFLEEARFGTVWDRFRSRTSVSARSVLSKLEEEAHADPEHERLRRMPPTSGRHRPQQLERLELPPAPQWSPDESKPVRRMTSSRRRTTTRSSAIIFPGQAGHELSTASRRASKKPAVLRPPAEIVFPGKPPAGRVRAPAKEEGLEMPECDGVPFRVLDPLSGNCRSLNMRSGCAPGQWFVLDRETRLASCQPHRCRVGFAELDGACHNLSDSSVCGPDMVLQVDEFGDAACDCKKGCVYWQAEQRCYPALMPGPCPDGQQLTVGPEGAACVDNPCKRDGWAVWPPTGACHPLRDDKNAPCSHGRMEVDSTTLELVCNDAVANSVFSTPSVRCATGSRRALSGRCKRTTAYSSISSPVRGNFGGSRCASGFVETPDGGCRKSSGGLGSLG